MGVVADLMQDFARSGILYGFCALYCDIDAACSDCEEGVVRPRVLLYAVPLAIFTHVHC